MKEELKAPRLTPAAGESLEELVANYRYQILEGAEQSAQSVSGELREISVQDIVMSTRDLPLGRAPRRRMVDRILTVYIYAGVLLAVGAMTYVLSTRLYFDLSSSEKIAAVAGFSGLIIAAFSYLVQQLRLTEYRFGSLGIREYYSPRPKSMMFLRTYQEIELQMRGLVASLLGESETSQPMSKLLSQLVGQRVLKEDDEAVFRELLTLRNRIVHQGEGGVSVEDIEAATKRASAFLGKIRRAALDQVS